VSVKKPQINVAVPLDVDAIISMRAERLHLTKSKFCALVLEKWSKEGAPAVSSVDAALERAEQENPTTARKARAL
jgi:hypothetical protein